MGAAGQHRNPLSSGGAARLSGRLPSSLVSCKAAWEAAEQFRKLLGSLGSCRVAWAAAEQLGKLQDGWGNVAAWGCRAA